MNDLEVPALFFVSLNRSQLYSRCYQGVFKAGNPRLAACGPNLAGG
jgi:hypothetical protein